MATIVCQICISEMWGDDFSGFECVAPGVPAQHWIDLQIFGGKKMLRSEEQNGGMMVVKKTSLVLFKK